MKNGRLQIKDIPTEPILRFLAQHQGRWSKWGKSAGIVPTVSDLECFAGVPDKLIVAKMGSLIHKGLSGGCDCGCRGDYEITDAGLALIGEKRTVPYNGY